MTQRARKNHWFEAFERDPRVPVLCNTVILDQRTRLRMSWEKPLAALQVTTVGHRVTCRACRYLLALPLPALH